MYLHTVQHKNYHLIFILRLLVVIMLLAIPNALIYGQSSFDALLSQGYDQTEDAPHIKMFEKGTNFIVAFHMDHLEVGSYEQVDTTKQALNGLYLDEIPSPFFHRIPYPEVIDRHTDAYIINGSFFKSYDPSTPLSYPIFADGHWITGGSSPYGPTNNPVNSYYGTIQLLAMQVENGHAEINTFNPEKHPLPFTIVSQNYIDHPAKVLAGNRTTRFLLATTLDENEDGKNEWLVFSIGHGRITDQAAELEALQNSGPIITLDGGTSVLFYHPDRGVLQRPQSSPNSTLESQVERLPHYLIFRKRDAN